MAAINRNVEIKQVHSNMKWSDVEARKAAAEFRYISVGTGKHTGRRTLAGAPASWAKGRDDYWLPDVRIVGPHDKVHEVLVLSGFAPDQIEQLFANAITQDNYTTTMKGEYENEILGYTKISEEKKKTRKANVEPTMDLKAIPIMAKLLRNGKVRESAPEEVQESEKRPQTRAGRVKSLADRLAELKDDEVIDVSKMEDSGKKAKNIPLPKADSKSARKGPFGGLMIVSNSLERYIKAIELLGGGHEKELSEARIAFTSPPEPVVAPVPTIVPVPTQTKATVAAPKVSAPVVPNVPKVSAPVVAAPAPAVQAPLPVTGKGASRVNPAPQLRRPGK